MTDEILRAENEALRAWAKDEQQKRERCEDQRTEERSTNAYQAQEIERLKSATDWLRIAEQRRTEEVQTAMAEIERLRAALEKHHDLLSDEDRHE